MPDLKHYDPDMVSINFAGISFQGFAEDTMVSIERETDDFTDVAGVRGEVTRSKSLDNRATITVSLMQSSRTNDRLATIRALDKASPNGAGVYPIMVRDRQGNAIHTGEQAWIARNPDTEYGPTPTAREWKFRVANLIDFDGGS
ncbi:MAG: DUF3277 family protein [Deltaproteobacteria bacterium]|nr:DUF3277 family protein [Deltaproteobacteria bacterium]